MTEHNEVEQLFDTLDFKGIDEVLQAGNLVNEYSFALLGALWFVICHTPSTYYLLF